MAKSPQLELVFEDALDHKSHDLPPLYTTSQAIKGRLRISGWHRNDFVVKLTFSGNLFSRISFPRRNNIKPPDLSLKHNTYECAIVHESSASSTFENDGPDSRTMPFRFPLDRRFLRRPDEALGTEELFHPSILVNSLDYDDRGAYCQVAYTVKATIICAGMKPIMTKREVRLVDETMSPSPPLCITDFGREYSCEQSRILKSKFSISQGRLTVAVAEPQPIEIVEDHKRAMARIPVKLIFEGPTAPSAGNMQKASAPSAGNMQKGWSASVDWTLKAATFVSAVAMRSAPTFEQARKSVFLRHAKTIIHSGHKKVVLTGWRQQESKTTAPSVWTLDSSLWLSILPEQLPPPTFSSHFLSRRYIVELQMRVSGEGSAVFDLNVPVQIHFPGGGMDASRRSSHSTMECNPPQYVR